MRHPQQEKEVKGFSVINPFGLLIYPTLQEICSYWISALFCKFLSSVAPLTAWVEGFPALALYCPHINTQFTRQIWSPQGISDEASTTGMSLPTRFVAQHRHFVHNTTRMQRFQKPYSPSRLLFSTPFLIYLSTPKTNSERF